MFSLSSKTIPFDSTLHGRDCPYLWTSHQVDVEVVLLSRTASAPTVELKHRISWHPLGYSFQQNLTPTYGISLPREPVCPWDVQSSHCSSPLFFLSRPSNFPSSTSKPSCTSNQIVSAPCRAVYSVASFPMQLFFSITSPFPHHTSPRHELTSLVTEQIMLYHQLCRQWTKGNQYIPAIYLMAGLQVRPTFPSFERVNALGKGADGDRLKQSRTQEDVFTEFQPLTWASVVAQLVKNLPAMQETPIQFLD